MTPIRPALRLGVALAAAASLIASALPLVARWWWVFDLFTHFRFQLIALQAAIVVALAWQRRLRLAVLVLIVLAGNLVATRDYLVPRQAGEPAIADLRIMTTNVLAENRHGDGLIAQVERELPTVLAIIEFTPSWAIRLGALHELYPYRIEVPRFDHYGIALFAREPIRAQGILDLGGTPAIDARLDTRGELRVIVVHTFAPITRERAARQQQQLELLATLATEARDDLVVLGDLNISPFSPRYGAMLERAGLHDSLVGHGPTLTWPTYLPVLGIVLDHCLLGPGWDSIAYRRQAAYGSDHYAITVDLMRKATP